MAAIFPTMSGCSIFPTAFPFAFGQISFVSQCQPLFKAKLSSIGNSLILKVYFELKIFCKVAIMCNFTSSHLISPKETCYKLITYHSMDYCIHALFTIDKLSLYPKNKVKIF